MKKKNNINLLKWFLQYIYRYHDKLKAFIKQVSWDKKRFHKKAIVSVPRG
jgi:hypothetical protein